MIQILMLPKFGFPPTDLCNRPLIPWIWEPKFFKGQSNVRQWTLQCLNWVEKWDVKQLRDRQNIPIQTGAKPYIWAMTEQYTLFYNINLWSHFFTDNYTYYSQLIWKLDPPMPLSLLAFYPTIIIRQGRWEMTVMQDYLLKLRK